MKSMPYRQIMAAAKRFLMLAASLGLATPAMAQQDYPARPVRILVGFLPGGSADSAARLTSQILGERFRQSFLVDNRAGANGLVAIQAVTSSPGDGYTMLIATTGALTISPVAEKNLPYNPLTSFKPVALVGAFAYALAARPDLPVSNVRGLVEYSKNNRGKLFFGSAGTYSVNQLGIEWLKVLTGLDAQHVPFKGGSGALTELMAGRIDFTLAALGAAMPLIAAGKIKGLAVTSSQRTSLAEGLPTVIESGVPKFVVQPWVGLVGPASLSNPIAMMLNETINDALKLPANQAALAKQGMYPLSDSPDGFMRLIAQELATWGDIVRRLPPEK